MEITAIGYFHKFIAEINAPKANMDRPKLQQDYAFRRISSCKPASPKHSIFLTKSTVAILMDHVMFKFLFKAVQLVTALRIHVSIQSNEEWHQ